MTNFCSSINEYNHCKNICVYTQHTHYRNISKWKIFSALPKCYNNCHPWTFTCKHYWTNKLEQVLISRTPLQKHLKNEIMKPKSTSHLNSIENNLLLSASHHIHTNYLSSENNLLYTQNCSVYSANVITGRKWAMRQMSEG